MKYKIKEARKKAGLTQDQLADLIGVKGGAIAKYETGRREVSVDMLRLIAKATNTEASWFIEDIELRPPTAAEIIAEIRKRLDLLEALILDGGQERPLKNALRVAPKKNNFRGIQGRETGDSNSIEIDVS